MAVTERLTLPWPCAKRHKATAGSSWNRPATRSQGTTMDLP
jgi:hypothetical protein